MSVRSANCPSCGGAIEFTSAASVMVVCPHCGTASVRRDVDLEKMGKVAEVAPIDSALSLGASGKWRNRRWTAVGQIQLDHGKGPWNEWCLAFENGDVGWLAEAQGEVIVTVPRPDVEAPLDQALGAGSKVALGEQTYVVAEAGSARVTAARGELPERIEVGETYEYFDMRGPNDAYATVAVHGDGAAEVYVGWAVPPAAIGVDESTVTRTEGRRAPSDRLACPNCGSPIELRDPANSQRVVCGSCGSMMDPRDRKLRVIEKAKRLETRPTIPIGAKTKFRGQDFEVLAFLVRSVRVDGTRYPWEEYLLRRKDGAYRWLVCANGHWTFAEPVNLGDVIRGPGEARLNHEVFRHFQGGKAVVDHVQGEVYWEVAIGETVESTDYVHPPEMLSFESTDGEVVVSIGRYVATEEMAAAFPAVARWPWQRGIAPNQPNPWTRRASELWKACGILAVVIIVLMIYFQNSHASRVVAKLDSGAPTAPAAQSTLPAAQPATAPAEDKGVVFSDEFVLDRSSTNLEIRMHAGVSNAFVGVDGALVNLDTGDVDAFALSAEEWHGVEDGESWSEGGPEATANLGGLPAGRYALRLDAEAEPQDKSVASIPFSIVARSDVPSPGRAFLLLSLLLVPPIFASLARASFEQRRWMDSDHPPGGTE